MNRRSQGHGQLDRTPFAIITGASTGIGYELAQKCLENGFDILIAANEPAIELEAATRLHGGGGTVEAVQADLSGPEGVEKLYAAAIGASGRRPARQRRPRPRTRLPRPGPVGAWRNVIDVNCTGTLLLLHKVGRDMRAAKAGRILITGSIAGFIPGTYQAVYNASKAFLDSFSFALRHELKPTAASPSPA